MKEIIRVYGRSLLFFLLALLFFAKSLSVIQKLSKDFPTIGIRLSSAVTNQMVGKMQETEAGDQILTVTAYSVIKTCTITEPGTGRSIKEEKVLCNGNIADVCPVTLIEGNMLLPDDEYGCMLSEDTAYSLFGTIHVTGAKVVCQDKTYLVRGIIESELTGILCCDAKDGDQFQNLQLSMSDLSEGRDIAEQFLLRYGIMEEAVVTEYGFFARLLKNGLILWPAVFFVYLLFKARKQIKSHAFLPWNAAGLCLAMAVFAIVLWKCGYIPMRLIPTKWSDFSFFRSLLKKAAVHRKELAYMTPYAADIQFRNQCRIYMVTLGLSIIFQAAILLERTASKTTLQVKGKIV
ncbi:MAG: ABC transporter permease [Lachnospiraceae bacterium]|nr:ABC transporter permease [Lachnospiraceae bacterium]